MPDVEDKGEDQEEGSPSSGNEKELLPEPGAGGGRDLASPASVSSASPSSPPSASSASPSAPGQPGVISSIEVTPYPSTMLSLLSLVIRARAPGSSVGAPVVVVQQQPSAAGEAEGGAAAARGQPCVVGVVIKRSSGKRRQVSSAGGGGLGGGRRRGHRSYGVGQAGRGAPEEDRVVAVATPLLRLFLESAAARDDAEEGEEIGGVEAAGGGPATFDSGGHASDGKGPAASDGGNGRPAGSDFVGLASLGIQFKTLMSASLRQALGMGEHQTGIKGWKTAEHRSWEWGGVTNRSGA